MTIGDDDQELAESARLEAHYRRLGSRKPRCSTPGCKERSPEALTGTFPKIVCYEHSPKRRGATAWQQQHPPGKANDSGTVPAMANDHRIWDDPKRDWPERTLTNPDGSPLLKAAATIRSLLDWCRALAERLLAWIPQFLEALDDKLRGLFGDQWWSVLGLSPP
jgi:hypothetical protein